MRILHIFRAPVGGLFRHVCNLAEEQVKAGHEVGLLCDVSGGEAARVKLAELAPELALGVTRLPMPRLPAPADVEALAETRSLARRLHVHVAHGHGAKGGLYARLGARSAGAKAVYTAHGGSLHYRWRSPAGAAFLLAERWLLGRTDGLVFVCDYERDAFTAKVGRPRCPQVVAHNGLREDEFVPVAPRADAADVLFVGEMRHLKGVDVLIEALALLRDRGRPTSAVLVGDGPDGERFAALVRKRALSSLVDMPGAMPARTAFALGRVVVVPSRAESFPYIVLEAQAAGRPVIASRVGGIPEMLSEEMMVPPEDAPALAEKIAAILADDSAPRRAGENIEMVRKRFSVRHMAKTVEELYHEITVVQD